MEFNCSSLDWVTCHQAAHLISMVSSGRSEAIGKVDKIRYECNFKLRHGSDRQIQQQQLQAQEPQQLQQMPSTNKNFSGLTNLSELIELSNIGALRLIFSLLIQPILPQQDKK